MNTTARIKGLSLGMVLLTLPLMSIPKTVFGAAKYIPVINGLFTTGQWYFDGDKSSLGGNAILTFVPAIRFSNSFSLIPTFETKYLGTRSAAELAGGNTLFQDTWENAVNLKTVQGLGKKWRMKFNTGARIKWFRETTDENFTNGLYDYQIFNVGTEMERTWSKRTSVALGYDYSNLTFPNYVSLESEQPDDLAREFAGADALDENIHLVMMNARTPLFWNMGLNLQSYYSPRFYTDQTVVEITGLFRSEKRKDIFVGGSLGVERMFRTSRATNLFVNLQYGYTSNDSNQNHFDARLTKFVANFYDYDEQSYGASLSLAVGRGRSGPVTYDISGAINKRDYRHRVTQTTDGNYNTDKLHITDSAVSLGFSYPLSRNFRIRGISTFGRSKSNNDYEAVYRYNYNNANYQFGFIYDY